MGFDQGDTDRLHRIAEAALTRPSASAGDVVEAEQRCPSCGVRFAKVNSVDAHIAALTRADASADGLREALEEISNLPGEINPSNYDHDDACELNRQFCYAITLAADTVARLGADR